MYIYICLRPQEPLQLPGLGARDAFVFGSERHGVSEEVCYNIVVICVDSDGDSICVMCVYIILVVISVDSNRLIHTMVND